MMMKEKGMKIRVNIPGMVAISDNTEMNTTALTYLDRYVTQLLNTGVPEDVCNVIMYCFDLNVMKELIEAENKEDYFKPIMTHIKLCTKLASIELTSKCEIIVEMQLKELF